MDVPVCTRGGDSTRYDYLFVLVADGRRRFIPSSAVVRGCCIRFGGPRYVSRFESEPDPIRFADSQRGKLLEFNAESAGFPSGQRDSAVNAAAQPSQVRILPPPSIHHEAASYRRSANSL